MRHSFVGSTSGRQLSHLTGAVAWNLFCRGEQTGRKSLNNYSPLLAHFLHGMSLDLGFPTDLLLILPVGGNAPEVILLSQSQAARGQYSREHRVVLVVVAVKPVAANRLYLLQLIYQFPQN